MKQTKLMSLETAAACVRDGAVLGLGGNVLHRAPMALVREVARQKRQALRLVKTAGAMDIDLLCLAGCVQSVDAGFVSYETKYGLASYYRKAVQEGRVQGNEHACYTVICALRAASYGVGFLPVKGLQVSDLIDANDYFTRIADPFTGESVTVVRAIQPDVVFLHVQEADCNGNARITGPQFEDILLSRAGKKVILTAERIVSETAFSTGEAKADIPHFLVSGVVPLQKGAYPCDCPGVYPVGEEEIERFRQIKDEAGLTAYLEETRERDHAQSDFADHDYIREGMSHV